MHKSTFDSIFEHYSAISAELNISEQELRKCEDFVEMHNLIVSRMPLLDIKFMLLVFQDFELPGRTKPVSVPFKACWNQVFVEPLLQRKKQLESLGEEEILNDAAAVV